MIYLQLFYVFFLIGLFTFGGGYAMVPIIKSEVLRRGWMSEEMFINFISISEATPGPLALNIATFVGTEKGGIVGSLVATVALILPSLLIIILVATIFNKLIKHPTTQAALNGIKPVIISLILTTLLFLLQRLIFPDFNKDNLHLALDRTHFILLIDLGSVYFIYQKFSKKTLNPIVLILIAALSGMLIFSV